MWEGFNKRMEGKTALKISLFIVVAGVFVVVAPLVFIWAINTLFALGIPLNFWTWLAAVVFLITIGAITSAGR